MKILKWIGIVLGALVILAAVALFVLYQIGNGRLARAPEIQVATVDVADDTESVARGQHLAQAINACIACHGEDLEGKPFIDESPIGYLPAPNLTSGAGGVGAGATDAQWAAAIRHGVGFDGRVMTNMPNIHYAQIGDQDLAALIAYLKQLPPVDHELGERDFEPMGTIIFGFLAFDAWPVNVIDHAAVGGEAPPAGPTEEYGAYLATVGACSECHGPNLAGNTNPDGPPMGPNITPGGKLAAYNENQFLSFMRSGITPDQREVSEEMPWIEYRLQTDEELQALWAYLSSQPSLADNP